MPRVTINGDDFGMNESCTNAILRALREGMITDATMMANGSFFDEAIQMAQEYRLTDRIGVHFNLTEGLPLTSGIMSIPLFVKDGAFHRAFLRQPRELNEAERQAVFAELCAQAERIMLSLRYSMPWTKARHDPLCDAFRKQLLASSLGTLALARTDGAARLGAMRSLAQVADAAEIEEAFRSFMPGCAGWLGRWALMLKRMFARRPARRRKLSRKLALSARVARMAAVARQEMKGSEK